LIATSFFPRHARSSRSIVLQGWAVTSHITRAAILKRASKVTILVYIVDEAN